MVTPQFWTGDTGRAIRAHGRHCQIMAAYLITSSSSSSIGIFYLPESLMGQEAGLSPEEMADGWNLLAEIDFAYYDRERWEVWVPGMARHQMPPTIKPADKMHKWLVKELNGVARSKFLPDFLRLYAADFHLNLGAPEGGERRGYERPLVSPLVSPLPRPSEANGHLSLDTEQERETDVSLSAGAFETIWAACRKKIGKGAAVKAFESLRKAGKLPPVEAIVAKLELLQETEQWSREDRRFQPHLATWLNREGWHDEVPKGGAARRIDPRRAAGASAEDLALYGRVAQAPVNLEELES